LRELIQPFVLMNSDALGTWAEFSIWFMRQLEWTLAFLQALFGRIATEGL
jgi:hypothetical protein